MSGRLDGRTAWISGAASGIGRATAERFLREGARVALVDVDTDRGRALEAALAPLGPVRFFAADVADDDAVGESVARTVAAFGGLEVVVNNAGIVQVGKIHETTEAQWDRVMAVNVKSIFLSTRHALPHLIRHPESHIVNVASVSSFVGQASTPAYTASKGAVLQLTRSIALDYAADGVRCNCVCPGITDTPMLRAHVGSDPDPDATFARRLRRVPLRRALAPDEIARAIAYFACADSAGVTGTSLVVDGGYTAAAEWDAGPAG